MNKVLEQTVQNSEARKASYPVMMKLLQHLRTNKAITDEELHPMLSKAYSEVDYYGDEALVMFKRVLFHIGDVSRQHNMLKSAGIQSSKGGAGERANFRSVMRWWEKNHKADFYSKLPLFADFTVLENLLYDQVRTDRMKGELKGSERMDFNVAAIVKFFAEQIIKSRNPLLARHLPKYASGRYRYTAGKKREKQGFTLAREKRTRLFINELIKKLGWDLKQYKEYRKRQNTPEQLFSNKEVLNLSEDLVMKMFDRMTSSQRFRVAHMIAEKDKLGVLTPKEKWGKLGELYIKWEDRQTKVAEEIRKTKDPVLKERVAKEFKVKATGLQTLDLLAKLIDGKDTDDQIDNTYQALLEKMDLVGNVFPVVDGSASMNRNLSATWGTYYRNEELYDSKYANLDLYSIAVAMGITFSTQNPNPDFKNSFGWFSNSFAIVGQSKYINTAPNRFVKGPNFVVRSDGEPVISDEYTFTKNLRRAKQANPGHIGSTNIGIVIEHFVTLHKQTGMSVEELPDALLFITDNEGNTGMHPKEFIEYAASIGWHPLVIFWGLKVNAMSQYEGVPNCLFIGGFSESVLSQILRGIKSGSIQPETELWSINDDKRYSVIA